MLIYIDDYFMKNTYFYKFNSYVYNEDSSKILKGPQNKVSDFTLVTGRYITASFVTKLKG